MMHKHIKKIGNNYVEKSKFHSIKVPFNIKNVHFHMLLSNTYHI